MIRASPLQAVKTWKTSTDPDYEAKKNRLPELHAMTPEPHSPRLTTHEHNWGLTGTPRWTSVGGKSRGRLLHRQVIDRDDVGADRVDPAQHPAKQEGVVIIEPSGERLFQCRQLLAEH